MPMCLPDWAESIPEEEREAAITRFWLRLAALYHSPEGIVTILSKDLGLRPNSLATYTRINPRLAVNLENLLGREHFPRELFIPDLFLVQE